MKTSALFLCFILVFWNLENFFLPNSENFEKPWSTRMFYTKCDAVSKTIFKISDTFGQIPAVIAFAEIESKTVLEKLIQNTSLRKCGYKIIHYESMDTRGIDCALLYNPNKLKLLHSKACHICDGQGQILHTRDIILAKFSDSTGRTFVVLVNHHPSKLSKGSEDRRFLAMSTLAGIADTIACINIISVGDFNEEANENPVSNFSKRLKEIQPKYENSPGSIKFSGCWQTIDRVQVTDSITAVLEIFNDSSISEKDKKYGGEKPFRTHIGPRYNGGVSDHYPIILDIQSLSMQ